MKTEIQNSVLPSLETITKQEVKMALCSQTAKGVSDAMKMVGSINTFNMGVLLGAEHMLQNLPNEIERVLMLIRPEIANQVVRAFSMIVTPVIDDAYLAVLGIQDV